MKILITGATGLVGSAFIRKYGEQHEITALSRTPSKASKKLGRGIRVLGSLAELDNLNNYDAVINLAGEPIAEKRWSEAQKERIENSRFRITEQLTALIKNSEHPPEVFISGSAVGFYGRQGEKLVSETEGTPHKEFSHELCQRWEQLANEAASSQTRVCLLRTGIVLARSGGALQRMAPPFKFGLGGPIGDGQQMMSWIHIADMVAAIDFLLNKTACAGAYNLTAPEPVNNEVFSKTLAKVLHRPAIFRVPAFVMRLAFGEMSDLLLTGQAVVPKRLLEAGFQFEYSKLEPALANVYPR
ncbi:TIGR01777 family protein [Aliidiomarina iranensis]|uniref:TIGR01777 family protein n=1 Tax=Aliidiomarina iranensis TaxID=1434071 RepID=A0A432VSF2_9GAMM|nr:TIGR01777 family oxidoreductase [Aliidiomarina iranensis]RUO19290.1 TIGR01777 family protein [Aliidiomarina iranensis]